MTARYACNAKRYAIVTPRFSSRTGRYACYAFISYGSHIRGLKGPSGTDEKGLMRIQHPQARNKRNSVTSRPPRKNKRYEGVQRYASTRNTAEWRTA